ncbi:hypothetical protein B0A75_16820 [Flavobacterium oncorhynchi]|uniref:Uncharacterized protein n=2 Tax=Flavobacterium oncorhynchi TaxID=728056 RepID=A0A226HTX8_9FLAO|nr:hypothetical protein B0A75_16820 [Flavobacterium oncorhynchi]
MSKYKTVFILLFSFFQLFSQNKIDSSELKKADSLEIFPKNNLMSELIGNWRMIDDRPSWVMGEDDAIVGQMITITTEEIQFSDLIRHAKSWKKVNTEKITYFNKLGNQSSYSELVYANNQIWVFYIDKKTGYLKLTYTGDKLSDSDTGRTEFVCSLLTKTYFKLL